MSRIPVIIDGRKTTVTPRYAALFLNDATEKADTVEPGADPVRPKNGDGKQDWYDYALRTSTPDELDGLTKADLIEQFG